MINNVKGENWYGRNLEWLIISPKLNSRYKMQPKRESSAKSFQRKNTNFYKHVPLKWPKKESLISDKKKNLFTQSSIQHKHMDQCEDEHIDQLRLPASRT